MTGALSGFRVLDLTQVISGPMATRILADQGADVVKVEPPKGDILRAMAEPIGAGPTFCTINRSKRSIVLDLQTNAAREVLLELVDQADVFIQNMRPGVAAKLGMSAEEVRARNPKIIYVSISGFGETGPFSGKRVYDPIIQGLSGLTDIQGGVQGPPRLMRVIVPDKVTALTAAQAITAALLARERTGQGQHVQLSMLDAVLAFMWPEGMAYHTLLDQAREQVDRRDLVYPTLDGHIIVSTVAYREFEGFCRAADTEHWLEDDRFQDAAGLITYARERLELMAQALTTRTSADWLVRLDAEDVPCGPVLARADIHQHPQVIANQILVEGQHPVAGTIRQPRPAERMDGTPSLIHSPAPALGAHTEEVLTALGITGHRLTALRASGAFGQSVNPGD